MRWDGRGIGEEVGGNEEDGARKDEVGGEREEGEMRCVVRGEEGREWVKRWELATTRCTPSTQTSAPPQLYTTSHPWCRSHWCSTSLVSTRPGASRGGQRSSVPCGMPAPKYAKERHTTVNPCHSNTVTSHVPRIYEVETVAAIPTDLVRYQVNHNKAVQLICHTTGHPCTILLQFHSRKYFKHSSPFSVS